MPVSPTRFSIELTKESTLNLTPGGSVLAVSSDGSQIVYTGLERAYLRSVSEFDMNTIPGTEGQGMVNPVFSPDGKSIAFSLTSTVRSREFHSREDHRPSSDAFPPRGASAGMTTGSTLPTMQRARPSCESTSVVVRRKRWSR